MILPSQDSRSRCRDVERTCTPWSGGSALVLLPASWPASASASAGHDDRELAGARLGACETETRAEGPRQRRAPGRPEAVSAMPQPGRATPSPVGRPVVVPTTRRGPQSQAFRWCGR